MAFTLSCAYYLPNALYTLFIRMLQDWIITAFTIRHAWQNINYVGWRRLVPLLLASTAVLVYWWSPEGRKYVITGELVLQHMPVD